MDPQIEKILIQANDLREQEKYSESAQFYFQALTQIIDKQDYTALVHDLAGQSLIYKHLAKKTGSDVYKSLALDYGKECLMVLEQEQEQVQPQAQSIALSTYADALLLNGKTRESLPYFEKSLAVSPARDPEKGRLKCHIGNVKYLLGDKPAGIEMINQGLTMIRTGDMNAYNIRVWETGALNELAKIYAKENDFEKAKSYIDESLKITADHNLKIRQEEAEKIAGKIAQKSTDFPV